MKEKRTRSTLPKAEARQRYVEIGELVVLEQIAQDAKVLDQGALAVGPFARLDAAVVAARTGRNSWRHQQSLRQPSGFPDGNHGTCAGGVRMDRTD